MLRTGSHLFVLQQKQLCFECPFHSISELQPLAATAGRGPATAGRWAPRPPGRQLETSGLGGAALANGLLQLAKPVVAGPWLPAR